MKYLLILSGLATIFFFAACNNSNQKQEKSKAPDTSTSNANNQTITTPVAAVVNDYLHLKNALASDNSKEAASGAQKLVISFGALSTVSITTDQKKIYDEVKETVREHAEHIAANGDKIDHQREHFEMLSEDVYDLLKAGTVGKTLYKTFCPMYNDNKGGYWLSETKEIKNPYYGNKMLTCGEIKEEIK